MPMLKFGNAAVVDSNVCPGNWVENRGSNRKGKVVLARDVSAAKSVVAKYDPNKWLLSHVTIMASVDVDYAKEGDPKSNYLIKPEYSIFVNNNGDSWERDLLVKASKSFLGADNYIEHVQLPELSKGKVIDVALREVPFAKDSEGKDLTTVYVDILIATSRSHVDIIQKIESGEYSSVSMGCLIQYSQCSQCGRIAEDESQACEHVRYYKKNYFIDKNGIKRIIAELCGRSEDPDSCKFIDASWVRKPAFEGAVLRNIVNLSPNLSAKLEKAASIAPFVPTDDMYLKAASEAKSLVKDLGKGNLRYAEDDIDFPKAPEDTKQELTPDPEPAPEAESSRFEEAPSEEAPSEEAPAEEAPADIPPDEGAPSMDDTPMGDAPMDASPGEGAPPPEPQIEEPKSDATVQEVKDLVKRQLLNQIRREFLKEQATEGMEERPAENELTSINDSIVKEAGFNKIIKLAKETGNDRLINGILILSNLKDINKFHKYGYSKKDMLGILHFIDKNISSNPVSNDFIKVMSNIRLSSDNLVSLFTDIIVETGKKPSTMEAKKIASWVKYLNKFE